MINILPAASILLAGFQVVSGLSVPHQPRADKTCTTKTQRKPWQDLTATEKSDYIDATRCLIDSPPKAGVSSAKTRWDEFQYAHAYQTPYIHGVGAFLPFHRYFITVHEIALRDECGYEGAMPYWTEASDVEDLAGSVIFDPETGFGGNGTGDGGCVVDGPFANLTLRIKEDLSASEYCLTRNLNHCMFKSAAQSNVDSCFAMDTFEKARQCLEGMPHGAGHGGVGALMLNVELSPGDPIFWLHHTYLDKLWWEWQSKDLENRLTDISGPNTPSLGGFGGAGAGGGFPFGGGGLGGGNASTPPDPDCPQFQFPFPGGGNGSFPGGPNGSFPGGPNGSFPGFPGAGVSQKPNAALIDYFNDGGNVTTLGHTLFSVGIYPNVTIGDVMDIRDGFGCAEYL